MVPSLHATAVVIGGEALLIRGPSRSGKSRLAVALIAHTTPRRPIMLIGDDRILLHRGPHGLVARPHPRIAGFLERRGLGLVAMDWVAEAPVGGVVELCEDDATGCPSPACGRRWPDEVGPDEGLGRLGHAGATRVGAPHPTPLRGATFSRLRETDELQHFARLVLASCDVDPDRVLAWWAARGAAAASHPSGLARAGDWPRAKD